MSISVIITCYNHGRYLAEAIESVLAQTTAASEIVVVDDGSTDNTQDIASQYQRVTYIHQPNQGLSAARNTGIRESSGEFLVFLDADDLLLPSALEVGLKCIRDTASGLAYGGYRIVTEQRDLIWEIQARQASDAYLELLRSNFIGMNGAVIFSRDALLRVGGFDPTLKACEDYDVYLKAAQFFTLACHDGIVAEYRRHGTNMSSSAARMIQEGLLVLRRHYQQARTSLHGLRAWQDGVYTMQRHYAVMLWRGLWSGSPAERIRVLQAIRVALGFGYHTLVVVLRRVSKRAAGLLRRDFSQPA